jgi:hypothetical protein
MQRVEHRGTLLGELCEQPRDLRRASRAIDLLFRRHVPILA